MLLNALALYLLLDRHAKYSNNTQLSNNDLKVATGFLKRVSKQLINTKSGTSLYASQAELSSALRFVQRANNRVDGNVHIRSKEAVFTISFRIPLLGDYYYLNAKATLLESEHGFQWRNGQISSLTLSKSITNTVFEKAVHILLGKHYGTNIISGINDVSIHDDMISMSFSPPSALEYGFAKAAKRFSAYSGQSLDFNTQRIQHYLAFLVDLTRASPKQNISVSRYIHALMNEAEAQTRLNALSAKDENLAALYALAVQVAPGTFRHFVEDLKVHRLNATYQPMLTLSNRHDLAKHFVYSMALHILSEKGMSFSLGEAKEILDTHQGGSGFSFADIAADLTGIRFAEFAIQDTKHAKALQQRVKVSIEEADFFPAIDGLPEGLSDKAFQDQFTDINSEKYLSVIKTIEARINIMRLFIAP
ncbi:MAG: hypothetical protein K6L80_04980 [Agarilytica sp.]